MAHSVSLSAVIITHNEAKYIGRCLDSLLGIADEVVVVDSYSTDDTVALCRMRGARVYQRTFEGFVDQKNYALTLAANDYILSLDADEKLSEELRQSILRVKQHWYADAYVVNRRNHFCGQWLRHSGWYPDQKVRLWDRRKGQWGGPSPHEFVVMDPSATIAHLQGDLLHYTAEDLHDFRQRMDRYADMAARDMFSRGRRAYAWLIPFRAAWTFFHTYVIRRGFLDGKAGFQIAVLQTRYTWRKYRKLSRWQRKPTGCCH